MKGFILVNAYLDDRYAKEPERLKTEFQLLGVDVDIIKNSVFSAYVDEKGNTVSNLSGYDFCIFWDKDMHTLAAFQKHGIKTFNGYYAVSTCDDKMSTLIALANNDIPVPTTLSAPLRYHKSEKIDERYVKNIESVIEYPIIIKTDCGSQGTGVWLVKNRNEFLERESELCCIPHIYQQFIASSYGKDLRVIVIGNEVIGGMIRQSENDFRSNVFSGGSGKAYPLSNDIKTKSLKIAKLLDLSYCGIDYLFGANGETIVCEVNSNAFFTEFERVTGINVAKKYAEYIIKSV